MNPALAICLGVGEVCGHAVNEARHSSYVDMSVGEDLVKVGEMSVLRKFGRSADVLSRGLRQEGLTVR